MNAINCPRALSSNKHRFDEENIDLRRDRPWGGREIHGWKYARSHSTRDRDSRLNRPQIAAKKARVGRVTFFLLLVERLAPRFLFSFDYPQAASPSLHPSSHLEGAKTGSNDGGYWTKYGWGREGGLWNRGRFAELSRNNFAESDGLSPPWEIPVIFSRWESIGPPTYAGRAAAAVAMVVDTLRVGLG